MPGINDQELDRKYRVLRQTLGIHSSLADSLARRSKIVEIILLACSVIFCATTFATDELYLTLGVQPALGKAALGIASVLAFAASLILLFVDWKGQSEKHRQAASYWSKVLALYRDAWHSDGTWDAEKVEQLNNEYWDADEHSVSLPSGKRFTKLKSKHLMEVAISSLKSKYPGCPSVILWLIVRFKDSYKALRDTAIKDEETANNDNTTAVEQENVVS